MAVLNITPDSFSDGGKYLDPAAAEDRALRLQDEGAHILDIGGESTRPGSARVDAKEEARRILPVLKRVAGKLRIPVSVDTYKAEVAAAALDAGASVVNDISALGDPKMAKVVARRKASVVLMHMRGTPETMQADPRYRSVSREVKESLRKAARKALDAGISRDRIAVDPGFGFGKTVEHNLELLRALSTLASLKLPVLVGLSRKSFIGKIASAPVEDRLAGSLAAGAAAVIGGAHILRVHDVAAHRQLTGILDRALE